MSQDPYLPQGCTNQMIDDYFGQDSRICCQCDTEDDTDNMFDSYEFEGYTIEFSRDKTINRDQLYMCKQCLINMLHDAALQLEED